MVQIKKVNRKYLIIALVIFVLFSFRPSPNETGFVLLEKYIVWPEPEQPPQYGELQSAVEQVLGDLPVCGNGVCQVTETAKSCPQDCEFTLFTTNFFTISLMIMGGMLIYIMYKKQREGK